jgi:hypothetical protein
MVGQYGRGVPHGLSRVIPENVGPITQYDLDWFLTDPNAEACNPPETLDSIVRLIGEYGTYPLRLDEFDMPMM